MESNICWKCEAKVQEKICIGDIGLHVKVCVLNPRKRLQTLRRERIKKKIELDPNESLGRTEDKPVKESEKEQPVREKENWRVDRG